MNAKRAWIVGVALCGLAGLCTLHTLAACSEAGTHIYEGRFYNEGRDCLGTISTVDVVDGPAPSQYCPVVCLSQKKADGGRTLYTSIMCAPYPFDFDTSGTDPKCAMALAAHTRNDTCLSDGGSSAPILPNDAGDAGDAAVDAGIPGDATTD